MFKKLSSFTIVGLFAFVSFLSLFNQRTQGKTYLSSFKEITQDELVYPNAKDFDQAPFTEVPVPTDLLRAAQSFLNFVSSPKFNYPNCATSLKNICGTLYKMDPENFQVDEVAKDQAQITKTLFEARIKIRERMRQFQIRDTRDNEDTCVTEIRNIFRLSRFIEDYLGEIFIPGLKPFQDKVDPISINTFSGTEPWLVKSDPEEVNFRSGDIIISRGNAYTSAAIGRITRTDSQFSHLAILYVKDELQVGRTYNLKEARENPNFLVLQEQVEIGGSVISFKDYLDSGNARNLLLRYPDPKAAHASAMYSEKMLMSYKAKAYSKRFTHLTEILLSEDHPDFNVPYNFRMVPKSDPELNEDPSLYCSQLVAVGYRSQSINLPLYPSLLTPSTENGLIRAMDIKETKIFAPGDMELDSRFEVLAEWRDFRKVGKLRLRDAILISMFRWMKTDRYEFDPSLLIDVKGIAGLLAREIDTPKINIAKLNIDISTQLPKNMTFQIAQMIQSINSVAQILEKHLKELDDQNASDRGGLRLSLPMMLDLLENYRKTDLDKFNQNKKSDFHNLFRPKA